MSRWRAGARQTLGLRRPWVSLVPRPSFHRTRTVAGAAKRSPIRQGWVAMDKIIVGIDVSKDRLDVAVRPSGEVFVVERNAAGLEELVERLRPLGPHARGAGGNRRLRDGGGGGLAAAGLPVVVVNPAQVRAFAKAIGQRAKTDPIDAARHRPFRRGDAARAAAAAGRSHPAARRSGRPPAADRRDDRRRAPAREAGAGAAQEEHRPARQGAGEGARPASTATSTMPCAARRPGARRRTCSPPCPASARSSPAR